MLLALVGIWNRNIEGIGVHAILPYDQHLHRLPAYLQQVDMESNGKSVDRDGNSITDYHTGPIIWGEPGTDAQHSFFQLIHQGTRLIPTDFILPMRSHHPLEGNHDKLVANCLAQSRTLMVGRSPEDARASLLERGLTGQEADRLAPHLAMPGNRPSRASAIAGTSGPDIRTTPIPPRPLGVARAAMVSPFTGRRRA